MRKTKRFGVVFCLLALCALMCLSQAEEVKNVDGLFEISPWDDDWSRFVLIRSVAISSDGSTAVIIELEQSNRNMPKQALIVYDSSGECRYGYYIKYLGSKQLLYSERIYFSAKDSVTVEQFIKGGGNKYLLLSRNTDSASVLNEPAPPMAPISEYITTDANSQQHYATYPKYGTYRIKQLASGYLSIENEYDRRETVLIDRAEQVNDRIKAKNKTAIVFLGLVVLAAAIAIGIAESDICRSAKRCRKKN